MDALFAAATPVHVAAAAATLLVPYAAFASVQPEPLRALGQRHPALPALHPHDTGARHLAARHERLEVQVPKQRAARLAELEKCHRRLDELQRSSVPEIRTVLSSQLQMGGSVLEKLANQVPGLPT